MSDDPSQFPFLGVTSVPIRGDNTRRVKAGDAVVFDAYPQKKKMTYGKQYIVENCWSSVIQVRCDTGRLVCYSSGYFKWPDQKE